MAALKHWLKSITLRRDLQEAGEVPPAIARQHVSDPINEEEYLSIRASILALIKRAGLTGDSLEHSHRAVLASVDLQWLLRKEMEHLLADAKAAGDRLRDPSLVLAPQVANHIRRELNRLTFSTWISPYIEPFLKSCCYIVACCTIVYVAHTLSQRDRPEIEELISAAGQNLNGWAKFETQNDLFGMLRTCQNYPSNGVDPQGRRYCSVLVIMNDVVATPTTVPAWVSSPHDGPSR